MHLQIVLLLLASTSASVAPPRPALPCASIKFWLGIPFLLQLMPPYHFGIIAPFPVPEWSDDVAIPMRQNMQHSLVYNCKRVTGLRAVSAPALSTHSPPSAVGAANSLAARMHVPANLHRHSTCLASFTARPMVLGSQGPYTVRKAR